MTKEQALKLAQALLNEYQIGWASQFCDDPPDWDSENEQDLANFILKQDL